MKFGHRRNESPGEKSFFGRVGEDVDMPLDLRMDLLVDGELTDEQRREFLQELDRTGARGGAEWRGLAVRFLQRQTEKETARALMAGGRVVPVEFVPRPRKFWTAWMNWRTMGVAASVAAAGVAIVAGGALVVVPMLQNHNAHHVNMQAAQFNAVLPAEAVGYENGLSVNVPLAPAPAGNQLQFPVMNVDDDKTARRSLVIEPDDQGGVITIPVDTLKVAVY